jgi:hypothetical protein
VATAAAGEDGEAGDQRVVARHQCSMVLCILRIAPPSAGEEPVSCHTVNAVAIIDGCFSLWSPKSFFQ